MCASAGAWGLQERRGAKVMPRVPSGSSRLECKGRGLQHRKPQREQGSWMAQTCSWGMGPEIVQQLGPPLQCLN